MMSLAGLAFCVKISTDEGIGHLHQQMIRMFLARIAMRGSKAKPARKAQPQPVAKQQPEQSTFVRIGYTNSMFRTNQPGQIQSILQQLEQLHKTPLETALLRHCQQLELVNQQDGTELIRFSTKLLPSVQKLFQRVMKLTPASDDSELQSTFRYIKPTDSFTAYLQQQQYGQLLYRDQAEFEKSITQAFPYWAQTICFIACQSYESRQHWYQRLTSLLPNIPIHDHANQLSERKPGIYLALEAEAEIAICHGSQISQMTVFMDRKLALHKKLTKALQAQPLHPVFAFGQVAESLTGEEEFHLQQVLGPYLSCSRQPLRLYHLSVTSDQLTPAPKQLTDVEYYEFKRDKVWQNKSANFWIAKLAQALADGNLDVLKQRGIDLDYQLQQPLKQQSQVCIVVENQLHGAELQTFLPDAVLEAKPILNQQLEHEETEVVLPCPGITIITLAEAQRAGLSGNAIIWTGNTKNCWGTMKLNGNTIPSANDNIVLSMTV
jgi:hypothetical protein